MRRLILSFCLLAVSTTVAAAQQYDLVLEGAASWILKPDWMLVRNVGIRDGKIARVSSAALSGGRVVHAGGCRLSWLH